jgi:hypothetical protein
MTKLNRLLVAGEVAAPLYFSPIVPIKDTIANPLPVRIEGVWNLATDSEWREFNDRLTPELRGLCTQVADPDGECWIFWHPYALTIHPESTLQALTVEHGAIPVFTELTPLDWLLCFVARPKTMRLKMFYSPKDLEFFMGWDAFNALIDKGWVEQKRRITIRTSPTSEGAIYGVDGKWYSNRKHCKAVTGDDGLRLILDDLKGNAPGSLAAMGEAVGIPLNKDIIDPQTTQPIDKSTMDKALQLNPQDFIRYAVDDAVKLHEIRDSFNESVLRIAREFFGIELKPLEVRGTNGSLVALCFKKWVEQQDKLIPYALTKLGRLSLKLSGAELADAVALKTEVEQWFHTYGPDETLEMAGEDKEMGKALRKYLKLPMESPGLSAASSVTLGQYKTSLAFSAMVQGGRAVNEAPQGYRIGRGADIDLSGCYGSALTRFTYPLGIPKVLHYAQEQNAKRITLEGFQAKHRGELVDNLWAVTVSGELPFSQDLIFSKRSTIAKINQAANSEPEDDSHDSKEGDGVAKLPGDFALTRREIQNGIVTCEILEVMDSVASKAEKQHLKKLNVESSVWYPESQRVDSAMDWAVNVLLSNGGITADDDHRYRGWVGLPIGGFIGPLLAERKRVKKAMNAATGEDKTRLNAEQNMLKLFINTLYGCLASPYFEIGNAVVANNITASARRGAWQMAKALGSVQSITDGGSYALDSVRFLAPSAKLPGFATLSNHGEWENPKKGRTVSGLGRLDWAGDAWDGMLGMTTKEAEGQLDALALEHITGFWNRYGLGFNFAIEHKGAHTFEAMAYWNKTDYAMQTVAFKDSKPVESLPYVTADGVEFDLSRCSFKVRGERFDFSEVETVAPKIELLIHILSESPTVPSKTGWVQTKLLSLKDYRRGLGGEGKRPGDSIKTNRTINLRNSHIPAQTFKEVDKRAKRREGFEKYRSLGMDGFHNRIVKDRF